MKEDTEKDLSFIPDSKCSLDVHRDRPIYNECTIKSNTASSIGRT